MSDEVVTAQTVAETTTVAPPVGGATVSQHFRLVFFGVLAITLLTLGASLYIGIFVAEPTEAAKSAMETCSTLSQLGFGAMVGLLGGKAVT
ncbi:hypothetical protein ACFW6E_38825 [Streptomyces olivaceoviridis]|uniref:hypothetical protein n=1 Tax=Streptomyces olivaceoviridis TaxID=1921 RepID=UPI0036956EB3